LGEKERADEVFSRGEMDTAIQLYKEALTIDPTLISAIMNQGAVYFIQKKYQQCIDCCSLVLFIFKKKSKALVVGKENGGHIVAFEGIPPPRTDMRRAFALTALCRRSAAYAHLELFDDALYDLTEASKIAEDATLSKDCSHLQKDIENITRAKELKCH